MKNIALGVKVFLILITILNFPSFGQTLNTDSLKKELIGTWKFVELRDAGNKKIDTIKHPFGYEIPEGPLLTYNVDGTYSKQFTPKNTDKGKWHFDNAKKAIVHHLYYTKPYDFASKDLIARGQAIKDKSGEYYEIIVDKIIKLSNDKLILLERQDRQRTFRKLVD